ncbi:MAG: S8 family serine peptidase [Chloroflexota bacterium]|nr:S8 family serine peptidase [Chloroflexota bacterium]
MKSRILLTGLIVATLLGIASSPSSSTPVMGDGPDTPTDTPEYAPNRVIIKFKEGKMPTSAHNMASQLGVTSHKTLPAIGAEVWNISIPVEDAIARYQGHPAVEYIEPDYIVSAAETIPNDPDFPQLWGLHNTGQDGGTPDADIDAPEAWDLETGDSGIIVAVIDSGIDYTHTDLVANMWTNPGEVAGNGVDDDGNGYIDDVYGIDTRNDDSDPMDDRGHGTHCAGIIGARGNNGIGVAGVSWDVQLMALKFLDSNGRGSISGAIEAIQYAIDHGAHIMNNSWGAISYSQPLYDAVLAARDAGILFVASAGNDSRNTDVSPAYPASFDLDNIISVAATNRYDNKAGSSNYGKTSVDVAAPGVAILSTVPGNAYSVESGTSMAAPHVSGLAVLVKAHFPSLTWREIKDRILYTTDYIASLDGKVLTGGRINAHNALTAEAHPQLAYYGINIDDAGALYPNGVLEPGETTDFYVVLRNDWVQADAVTATLSSPSSYVTVSLASAIYGDIGAGEIVENQSPFVVSLAPETPPGFPLPFELYLTYQYNTHAFSMTLPFTYTPSGGNAWLYLADRTDDGGATWPNDLWEPGETIDFYVAIQNDWASSEHVSATLSSSDGYVTIQRASASYGERFLINEIKESDTPFVVQLDPAASADREIPFELALIYRRNGVTETASIPFSYSATRVHIVEFPDPKRFFLDTVFAIDGDVGYVPSYDRDVLWSFSALTGELLDKDGLTLPGTTSTVAVFSNDRIASPGWFPDQGIFVADASDPRDLRQIGVIPFPSTTNIQAQLIQVDDDGVTGYVVGYNDWLYAFNIDTMTVVDGLALPGGLDRLTLVGDRVAAADKTNGRILVVDVSDPSDLTLEGIIELPGSNAFASINNIVFAGDGRTGFIASLGRVLHSFDVVDVALLDPDGILFGDQEYGESIAIHGTTVAAMWSSGLTFIDASDPTDMQIISDADFGEPAGPQGGATVAFLKNGELAAIPVVYPDNLVFVFDVATGQKVADPLPVDDQPNFLTTYGADDRIGVLCDSGTIHLISKYPVPEPDVAVQPTALTIEASYGDTITRLLTITNTGALDLMWNLEENPVVDWLDRRPTGGTTDVRSEVVLTFTTTITPGTYLTSLEFDSNDPDERSLNIPVTLTLLDAPNISVDPSTLKVPLAYGATTTRTLVINNVGSLDLDWSLAKEPSVPWLNTHPTTGILLPSNSTSATLVLTAPITLGIYTTTLTITSNDPDQGSLRVPVILDVPVPDISAAPSALTVTLETGTNTTRTLTISNTGSLDLDWSLIEDPPVPWLVIQSMTGTVVLPSDNAITTLILTAPIISDTYTSTLMIISNDPDEGSLRIPVTLTALDVPNISVDPNALTMTLPVGTTATHTLTISNTGSLDLDWNLIQDPPIPWPGLVIWPTTGTVLPSDSTSTTLFFTASPFSFTHTSKLTIISNDPDEGSLHIPITLTALDVPNISVNPNALTMTLAAGTAAARTLTISNSGSLNLDWSMAEEPPVPWLGIHPVNGTILPSDNASATLVFTAPIISDTYTSTLTITSNDPDEGSLHVPVTLDVLASDISVDPSALTITLAAGTTTTRTLAISNTGSLDLDWSLIEEPPVPWLDTHPTTGTVLPSSSTTATLVLTTPITSSTYTSTLTITSNDPDEGSLHIPVTLSVLASDISVNPSALTMTLAAGTTVTRTLTISNTGSFNLDWNLAEEPSVPWLTTQPATGIVLPSASITATLVLTTPITSGIYTSTLTIISNDPDEGSLNVPVTMDVLAPDISVTPSALTVTLATGTLTTHTLTIGNPGSLDLDWSLVQEPPVSWMDTHPTTGTVLPSGSNKVELFLTAPVTLGVYTTTLKVTSNDPDENSLDVQATLKVVYHSCFLPLVLRDGS